MKKKILLILSFIISINIFIHSQETAPKVLIMGVPQYLFKNGLRIDFDIPSQDYKAWWVLSPQYFIDVSELGNLNNKKYEQMHGYGLSIHRKGFLTHDKVAKGAYISGGLGLQHYNFLTNSERWVKISQNGTDYMQLESSNYHLYINKVMTEAIIGFQKEIASRLYLDIFAGVGLRYSFYDQPSGSSLKFNKNIFDYGYTGTAFIAGLRLGVGL